MWLTYYSYGAYHWKDVTIGNIRHSSRSTGRCRIHPLLKRQMSIICGYSINYANGARDVI